MLRKSFIASVLHLWLAAAVLSYGCASGQNHRVRAAGLLQEQYAKRFEALGLTRLTIPPAAAYQNILP